MPAQQSNTINGHKDAVGIGCCCLELVVITCVVQCLKTKSAYANRNQIQTAATTIKATVEITLQWRSCVMGQTLLLACDVATKLAH
jgi:hypothetical protein